ncbi:MAG: hypothetical protein ACP5GY_04600 [Vulcanisaeta sp.]
MEITGPYLGHSPWRPLGRRVTPQGPTARGGVSSGGSLPNPPGLKPWLATQLQIISVGL